jgi:hypothetical protein
VSVPDDDEEEEDDEDDDDALVCVFAAPRFPILFRVLRAIGFFGFVKLTADPLPLEALVFVLFLRFLGVPVRFLP